MELDGKRLENQIREWRWLARRGRLMARREILRAEAWEAAGNTTQGKWCRMTAANAEAEAARYDHLADQYALARQGRL